MPTLNLLQKRSLEQLSAQSKIRCLVKESGRAASLSPSVVKVSLCMRYVYFARKRWETKLLISYSHHGKAIGMDLDPPSPDCEMSRRA